MCANPVTVTVTVTVWSLLKRTVSISPFSRGWHSMRWTRKKFLRPVSRNCWVILLEGLRKTMKNLAHYSNQGSSQFWNYPTALHGIERLEIPLRWNCCSLQYQNLCDGTPQVISFWNHCMPSCVRSAYRAVRAAPCEGHWAGSKHCCSRLGYRRLKRKHEAMFIAKGGGVGGGVIVSGQELHRTISYT
jgi:hypothetical protein